MKILRVLIVLFFLIATAPLEAFCHDSHCVEGSGCSLTCCHMTVQNVIVPAIKLAFAPPSRREAIVTQHFFYKNPIVFSLKKPPIVLS